EAHVAPDHLAEVVARAERRPGALEHDRADARIGADGAHDADQLLHQREAQRVALVGAVERDRRRGSVVADEDVARVGRGGAHARDDTPPPASQRSMSTRAMARGGGTWMAPRPAAASASSSPVNQRASSSSPSRAAGSPPAWSAKKPSMSEVGNGQGCEAT